MVVGKQDPLKGEIAVAFIVLKQGSNPSDDLAKELRATLRKTLGAVAVVDKLYFVKKIPMNISGKVMRRLGRALIRGIPFGDTSTLDDPTSVDELKRAIQQGGY
jgi:acetyl-CoA synthetase